MMGQTVFPLAQPPLGRFTRGEVATRAKALVPRISTAVRVPDPRHAQFSVPFRFPPGHPQIYVHEGARQALERRLALANSGPVNLSVTDNRRNMISFSHLGGLLLARIHHMFLDAPANVQDALVRYVVKNDRAASLVVGKFIEEHGYRIRATRPVLTPLSTQGETHDLLSLFRSINEKYFGGAVDALITWGKRGSSKKARRSIKLGSYSAVERLIRIHPNLDKPWVPRYFISFIIYHEMLHHVIPSSQGNGRAMLHPAHFRERERLFRDYERALAWEKAHVGRLLRS